MQTSTQTGSVSTKAHWAGRILSGLVVLFLLFDGAIKLVPIDPVTESLAQLGYPVNLARGLGVLVLVCTVFYVIPRTAVLGAILLTGLLGGAIATQQARQRPGLQPSPLRRLSRRDGLGRTLPAR